MVFLEVLAMFKRIQYTFAFFLCLTMLICLLPAAYADGLSDLQAAIAGGAESYTLTESLTIPAGLELGEIQTTLIVPNGITLTIAGGDSGSGRRELSVGDLDIQSGGRAVIEDNALLEVKGRLTLNGQLTIGEHSELYITDQDEALVSSSNIRKGNSSHIVVHYYPDDDSELYTMFVSAEALPAYAHGNIHVRFDWEMGSDFDSGKTDFHFHAPVTIVSSFSLGNLYVDGPLTVNGTLSVGNLHAWSGSELVFTDQSTVTVSESFDLQGSLWIPDTIDLSDLSDLCLDPGKLAVLSYDDGGCLYVNADAGSELRNAFLSACDKLYAEPATFVIPEGNIINLLYTPVNIPGNLTVFAIGSGFRISDAPFSVEGELICSRFTMMTREGTDSQSLRIPEGGSMYVERNFQLGSNCRLKLDGELSVEHDAFNPNALVHGENFFPGQNSLLDVSFNMLNEQAVLDELNAQVQPFGNFRRSIWVHFPWTLTDDVTVPAQVRLCVPHDGNYQGSLTIPAGKTLTINEGGEMLARGSVNGEAVIQVNGSLVNDGSINLGDPGREADIALGPNGRYSGSGSITRGGAPYYMSDDDAWDALVAACTQEYDEPTELSLEGAYHFAIPADGWLYIPENLRVFAPDSTFTVTNPASLIVRGDAELHIGSLDSQGFTDVEGYLAVGKTLNVGENQIEVTGTMELTLDSWVELMFAMEAESPDDVAAKFSFGADGLLDIWYDMTDSQNVAESLNFEMFHIPHIRETLCLNFPWTLDQDRTLDVDRSLFVHYGDGADGMLIIPEGMTLTIPEGSELTVRSAGLNGEAAVLVMGVLINNGSIDLTGAADLALVNGGVYSGGGTVRAAGAPCVIRNDPANADIRLPAGLETLESEALADGDFFSVYIPAGTASIATDAFGGKEALIVYGVPGSEAENFAHSKSFLFAPVA